MGGTAARSDAEGGHSNPIKQYEPYFSATYEYEDDASIVEQGVTPLLHYDPLGRLIRTDLPNGSYSYVEFDPWKQASYESETGSFTGGHVWHDDTSDDW